MNDVLSNRQLIEEVRLRLDEAHNPGWYDNQLAVYLNGAIYEWVSEKYNSAEVNEKNRSQLTPLTFQSSPALTGKDFELEGLFILSVEADYGFECAGVTTSRTVPVRPLRYDTDQLDPYGWGGSDYFPGYLVRSQMDGDQKKQVVSIISPGNPSAVRTTCLSEASLIKLDEDGELDEDALDNTIGLPRLYQLEIIDRAVRTITGVAENAFRVQTQAQLEIPAKS